MDEIKNYNYIETAGRLLKFKSWVALINLVLLLSMHYFFSIFGGVPTVLDNYIVYFVVISLCMCVIPFYIGNQILDNQLWAKIVGILIGVINLASLPFGPILSIVFFYHIYKGWNQTASLA